MKRSLKWLLIAVIVVVGVTAVLRQVFPVITVAGVHSSPELYEGRMVGLHVVRATVAAFSRGTCLTVLQDASGVDLACASPLRPRTFGTVWVKIAVVQVLGKPLVVAEPQAYGNRLLLLARYLLDAATPTTTDRPVAPKRKNGDQEEARSGKVTITGSWAGMPVFVLTSDGEETLTVVTSDPAPPVGTEVRLTPTRIAGLRPTVYQASEVVTQLHSLIENCSKFEGKTITVEGRVCPGIALLGSSAFGLEDDAGRSVLVLGRDLPKPAAERARVRGRVQVLMDSRAAKLVFVHGLHVEEIKAMEQVVEGSGPPEEAPAAEEKLEQSSAPTDGGDAQ